MKMKNEKALLDYISLARTYSDSQERGDFTKSNKAADRLRNMMKKIQSDPLMAKQMIDSLMTHTDPNVLTWTSILAFDMNYRKKEFAHILKSIAKDKSIGMQQLEAEMVLKEIYHIHFLSKH